MLRKWIIAIALLAPVQAVVAQHEQGDTVLSADPVFSDTSILDYDELFRDFDAFMDSILTPRSYFLANVAVGRGYFNFDSKTSALVETVEKLRYAPTLAYYHKGGLGLTATGYLVNDEEHLNFYQGAVSPSYDYVADRRIATGISYTRYFTRDSLPFYTTPLENELYAYFMYRANWLKPAVSLSYGWGNRSDYAERESLLQDLRLRRLGYTYVNTEESIRDFIITASVRHDFYFLDVIANRDHIRLTPQLAFMSGTQKFGFNQSSTTYGTLIRNGNSVLFSSDNVYLDDQVDFQPLSLTLFLRTEYSIGKFFVQPQVMLDYYFPAESDRLNALFSVNLGCLF